MEFPIYVGKIPNLTGTSGILDGNIWQNISITSAEELRSNCSRREVGLASSAAVARAARVERRCNVA
jgi:hypothetical protein